MNIIEKIEKLSPKNREVALKYLTRSQGDRERGPKFSIFFFSDMATGDELYDLLFSCAEFADKNSFEAIWVPERHFHPFGGSYPNPSILAAAVASRVKNIRVCAGSVLAPLHHPLRIAEEWAVVDHISSGGIGLALASGWQKQDFVFNPEGFESRREVTLKRVEQLRELWSGASLAFEGPDGEELKLRSFPAPKSNQLPLWLTAASNPETWLAAARSGCGVLTGLMEQSYSQLAERIVLYRSERERVGLNPDDGRVTLMVHTFIGEDDGHAKEMAKPALSDYLYNHMSLYSLSLAANKSNVVEKITEKDRHELVELGIQRYFEEAALIGGIDKVEKFVTKLSAIGVDEIATLVNFGIPEAEVLAGLERVAILQQRVTSSANCGVQQNEY